MDKKPNEDDSCRVLNIIDTCKHKNCNWTDEPCVDCKYNPSRYIKIEPMDRYEKVK